MEKWPAGLSPQELGAWLNRQYGVDTLMNRLKMRVAEVGPERAVVEIPAHPGLYTPHGYIHAGVMLALAATRVTDGGGRLLALVNSTHYVRPRPGGKFDCRNRIELPHGIG